jgi:hypothetical protein
LQSGQLAVAQPLHTSPVGQGVKALGSQTGAHCPVAKMHRLLGGQAPWSWQPLGPVTEVVVVLVLVALVADELDPPLPAGASTVALPLQAATEHETSSAPPNRARQAMPQA